MFVLGVFIYIYREFISDQIEPDGSIGTSNAECDVDIVRGDKIVSVNRVKNVHLSSQGNKVGYLTLVSLTVVW